MDVGLLMLAFPGKAQEIARRTEAAGFTHLALGDTQNLGPETWGQLMLVAGASERIRIGTGVTNTTTRDVAVTASAALALQQESGGRAFCGIGRGDSALAKIGRKPAPPDEFEADLASLRAYLGGDATPRGPATSRIEWSRGLEIPRVPIEVAVSGPRVLEIAARHADAFIFCIGADAKTLERAIQSAREVVRRAGRDPEAMRYGAFVNCAVDDDLERARAISRGGARFRTLSEIGLDFITIAPGSSDMDWEAGWRSIERIGREVIPALC